MKRRRGRPGCGRSGLGLVALCLLLAGPATAQRTFPAHQQATLDSLREVHRTLGADSLSARVAALLPAARAAGDSAYVMRLLGMRGGSLVWYKHDPAAIDDLREAVALARALGDSASVGRSLLWLAQALEYGGQQTASTTCYEQLLTIGEMLGNPYFAGRGSIGVAWDRWLHGQYAAAESLYTAGHAFATAATDTFSVLWSGNGLGLTYWNTGRLALADSVFTGLLRDSRRADMVAVEAAVLNNHAGLLEVLGRFGEALAGYEQALALQRRQNNPREALPATMNIARCQLMLGRLDQSAATLEALVDDCRQEGYLDFLPGVLEHLAIVQLEQDRPALASRTCREGLAMSESTRPRYAIQLRLTLARALAAQDSLAAAQAAAEQAARLPSAATDLHMHTEVALVRGSLALQAGQPDRAARILAAAAQRAEAGGLVPQRITLLSQAGEAQLLAEDPTAARHTLQDALHLWESSRTLPDDPVWRERRSASARRLFEALAELTIEHPDSVDLAVRLNRSFDLLQHFKARTLLERSLGPGRELADPRPVTLRDLQARILQPGEVFLDAYLGERHGLLYVATRDTLLAQPLRGREAATKVLDAIQGLVSSPQGTVPVARLQRLATALLDDSQSILPPLDLGGLQTSARTICWSPDGELHRLPLSVLLQDRDLPVVRTPSATFLANLRLRAPPETHPTFRILAAAGLTDGQGRPLTGASAEVAWLAQRFHHVEAVRDSSAATPFGGHDPAEYDLLHVAAHAEIDAQHPWNSALIFGRPENPVRLPAGQVAELQLGARLAVLTSCSSASGAICSGEGMLGLASGFLSAGVPTVLATLWPVADRDAADFSRHFYSALADGRTVAEALLETQRRFRADAATAHPYHWAGYVVVGDGSQTVALDERKGKAIWIAMGSTMIAACCTILVQVRRAKQG